MTIVPANDDDDGGGGSAARRDDGDAGGVDVVVAFDGTKHHQRFCCSGESSDDRMSAFDPLARIETEPMNLPARGLRDPGEIKPGGYRLVRGVYSLFVPLRQKFSANDGRIYLAGYGI